MIFLIMAALSRVDIVYVLKGMLCEEKVQHKPLTVSPVQPVSGVNVGAGAKVAAATAGATGA